MVGLKEKKPPPNTVAGVNLFPEFYSGAGGSAANDKQVSCALRDRLVLGCIMQVSAALFQSICVPLTTCHSLHAPTAFMTL